jgi:hypothetical protein
MKKSFLLVIAGLFLFAACNSDKTKDSTTETNTTGTNTETTGPNTTTTTNPVEDMTKAMEEMKKIPTLSTDQIKAMLPQELIGMKRSSFSANSMMGYATGEARYKSDDGKEIKLTIFDCAGPAGAGLYSMMYWGAMNMESEDENGYKKTTNFNGGKAIESYEKYSDKYGLMYVSGNRLLVNIEGERTGLDAVKQAAQSLNLASN